MKTLVLGLLLLLSIAEFGGVLSQRRKIQELQHIYRPLVTLKAPCDYKNQVVPLDGNKYVGCTFENVTFRWRGTPYSFENVHITGSRNIEVDGVVSDVVYFLGALNLLNEDLNRTLHQTQTK